MKGKDLYGFMFSTPEIYKGDREHQPYFICYYQNALSAGRCVRPMKLQCLMSRYLPCRYKLTERPICAVMRGTLQCVEVLGRDDGPGLTEMHTELYTCLGSIHK
jgi:hypothetical protein